MDSPHPSTTSQTEDSIRERAQLRQNRIRRSQASRMAYVLGETKTTFDAAVADDQSVGASGNFSTQNSTTTRMERGLHTKSDTYIYLHKQFYKVVILLALHGAWSTFVNTCHELKELQIQGVPEYPLQYNFPFFCNSGSIYTMLGIWAVVCVYEYATNPSFKYATSDSFDNSWISRRYVQVYIIASMVISAILFGLLFLSIIYVTQKVLEVIFFRSLIVSFLSLADSSLTNQFLAFKQLTLCNKTYGVLSPQTPVFPPTTINWIRKHLKLAAWFRCIAN